MKKIIALTAICALFSIDLYSALPSGSTLTNIPASNPNFLHPSEWLNVATGTTTRYTLRFRAYIWNGLQGDLYFLMEHRDSSNATIATRFLFRSHNDLVGINATNQSTISGEAIDATLAVDTSWHEIRVYDQRVTFVRSNSSSGPWTQYFEYNIPSTVNSQMRYGFASYNAPSYYMQMSHFTFTADAVEPTPHNIVWQDQGGGTHQATATKERVYTYNESTAYSASTTIASLTGPMQRTMTNGKWAYDTATARPASGSGPAAWTWLATYDGTQYNYRYDPTTNIWQPIDWDSGPGPSSLKVHVPWTYDPVALKWENTSQQESWTYNSTTKKWTCVTTADPSGGLTSVWSYNPTTLIWTNESNNTIWRHDTAYRWIQLNGHSLRGDYTTAPENGIALKHKYGNWYGPTAQGHLWQSTDRNFYQSNDVDQKFQWLPPTEAQARGRYLRYDSASDEGSSEWTYYNNNQWFINDEIYGTKHYFPYDFPPLAVLQHYDIILAHDTAEEAGIISPPPSGPEPTATWNNNGRNNAFGLDMPYDTAADPATAPLKATTSSPDTQLLHDLTQLPAYTALGSWQHKDTTNSHTWEFNKSTGIWRNTTTGYEWQYSDLDPGQWSDSFNGTAWSYDENTGTWSQIVTEDA